MVKDTTNQISRRVVIGMWESGFFASAASSSSTSSCDGFAVRCSHVESPFSLAMLREMIKCLVSER